MSSYKRPLQNLPASALNVNTTLAALIVHPVDASGAYAPPSGSTQVSIKEILSSSGGSLVDSTNVSLGVTIRAGSASGTEYTDGDVDATPSGGAIFFENSSNTLRPVTIGRGLPVNVVAGSAASTETTVRQSTYADFNALSRIADRDASTNIVNVTNTTPASTAYGLVVREAVAQSTGPFVISSVAGPVTVRSSAANLLASVYQSTAADLNVTVAGYSTTVNVSSLAGPVICRSSAADMLVTASQNSTAWSVLSRVTTSSGGGIEGSTNNPAQSVIGLHVRQVPSSMVTVAASTVGATATNTVLVSSVAGVRHKVYAFSVTSTVIAASTCSFRSSLGAVIWPMVLGSGSSGITGANLAVAPPAFLFATAAANALTFHTPSSGAEFHVAVSYFTEA